MSVLKPRKTVRQARLDIIKKGEASGRFQFPMTMPIALAYRLENRLQDINSRPNAFESMTRVGLVGRAILHYLEYLDAQENIITSSQPVEYET